MHAESVADCFRHKVQRLQNCVARKLSLLFYAPTDLHVLMNGVTATAHQGDSDWSAISAAAP